jgi:hypothetical protein
MKITPIPNSQPRVLYWLRALSRPALVGVGEHDSACLPSALDVLAFKVSDDRQITIANGPHLPRIGPPEELEKMIESLVESVEQ